MKGLTNLLCNTGNCQKDSDQRNKSNVGIRVKLATLVEGDQKAPFSIATTPRCRGALILSFDCSTLTLIVPYNTEC